MYEREIQASEGPGLLPNSIVSGGNPINNWTLPSGQASDLTWAEQCAKLFVQNRTDSTVKLLIDDVGCSPGKLTVELESGAFFTLGVDRPHLFSRVSILPAVSAVIYSASGPANLTVLAWRRT